MSVVYERGLTVVKRCELYETDDISYTYPSVGTAIFTMVMLVIVFSALGFLLGWLISPGVLR